jgi:hypothetical protein
VAEGFVTSDFCKAALGSEDKLRECGDVFWALRG